MCSVSYIFCKQEHRNNMAKIRCEGERRLNLRDWTLVGKRHLQKQHLNGSHVQMSCTQMFYNSRTESWRFSTHNSISATYVTPSLLLSLDYCDMRYTWGKFLPQHGNILFQILQHCIQSAMFDDCLNEAIRAQRGSATRSAKWYNFQHSGPVVSMEDSAVIVMLLSLHKVHFQTSEKLH